MEDERLLLFAYEDSDDVVKLIDITIVVFSQDQAFSVLREETYPTRFAGRSSTLAASSGPRARLAEAGVLAISAWLL